MLFTVTAYERSHRQPVLDLIFRSHLAYTHLDWQEVGQWLDSNQTIIRLAWQEHRIVGIMGVSLPLYGTCWLRVASVSNDVAADSILPGLWAALRDELGRLSVNCIAALIVEDWLLDYLPALGFVYQEQIITLSRIGHHPPLPKPSPFQIRAATFDDLEPVTRIDQSAFIPPWQMSAHDIRQAARIAATFTVAVRSNNDIIGYQISTLYSQNGHLARLAVLPEVQGLGIGSSLLTDLIRRLANRSVRLITVNTQESNERSQKLYLRYGFQRNGYDLPVWMATL